MRGTGRGGCNRRKRVSRRILGAKRVPMNGTGAYITLSKRKRLMTSAAMSLCDVRVLFVGRG
jgi:hypothetical protein